MKCLLVPAYFWRSAQNAVELQLWVTWLMYAFLVGLTEQVAEARRYSVAPISMERVDRSLYFFTQNCHREEDMDVAAYQASHAKLFGLVKYKRPTKSRSPRSLLPLTILGTA